MHRFSRVFVGCLFLSETDKHAVGSLSKAQHKQIKEQSQHTLSEFWIMAFHTHACFLDLQPLDISVVSYFSLLLII